MKGKITYILFSAVLLSGLTVFAGPEKEEKRDIDEFSSLSLGIVANVLIYQGSKTELTIIGDPSTIEHIETRVVGGVLKIRYDKSWSFWDKYDKVKIILSSPAWEGISVSGSGVVKNANKIKESNIDLSVSGSGMIKLDGLTCTEVNTRVSGSGDINIAGTEQADLMTVSISGSGDVDALGLTVDKVKVRISGSGDASVSAVSRLDVSISGSGDVDYLGDAIVDARISGSGDVRKKD